MKKHPARPTVKAAILNGALVITIPVIVRVENVPAPLYSSRLTSRQAEILDFIDRGLQNKEIASVLHLSLSSIKKHVAGLMSKYEVPSRYDLIGIRAKLTTTLTEQPDETK